MTITLSIIAPVYNVELYLSRCIDSVLRQTLQDWELILVDDKSTDSCPKICEAYSKRDARIITLHQPQNQGIAHARNTGLLSAKGKYIAFLDPDDWVEPNMYQDLIDLLNQYQADAAEGSFFIDTVGKSTAVRNDGKCVLYSGREAILKLHTRETITDKLWTRVYKKECIPFITLDKKIIVGEDYCLAVHIFEKCSRVVYAGIPYYHYFQRYTSVCNHGFQPLHKYVVENCIHYREYLGEKYPEIKATATAKLLYDEMSVLAAMVKNKHYDPELIRFISKDVRLHRKECAHAEGYTWIMQLSTILVSIHPKLLMILYSIYYRLKKNQFS